MRRKRHGSSPSSSSSQHYWKPSSTGNNLSWTEDSASAQHPTLEDSMQRLGFHFIHICFISSILKNLMFLCKTDIIFLHSLKNNCYRAKCKCKVNIFNKFMSWSNNVVFFIRYIFHMTGNSCLSHWEIVFISLMNTAPIFIKRFPHWYIVKFFIKNCYLLVVMHSQHSVVVAKILNVEKFFKINLIKN